MKSRFNFIKAYPRPYPIMVFLLILLVSCSPKSTNSDNNNNPVTPPVSNDGNVSGGNNNGGGNNNSGGGDNSGLPNPYLLTLRLAGHTPWIPHNHSDNLAKETIINLQEAANLFRSDSRLQLRFKPLARHIPRAGEVGCYNRKTGAADAHEYTKLSFRVRLADYKCQNPVGETNLQNCVSFEPYELGTPYKSFLVDQVAVNEKSPILNLGHERNAHPVASVVIIDEVKSDSNCLFNPTNDFYCPVFLVRQQTCWQMEMEVATDYTKTLQ